MVRELLHWCFSHTLTHNTVTTQHKCEQTATFQRDYERLKNTLLQTSTTKGHNQSTHHIICTVLCGIFPLSKQINHKENTVQRDSSIILGIVLRNAGSDHCNRFVNGCKKQELHFIHNSTHDICAHMLELSFFS